MRTQSTMKRQFSRLAAAASICIVVGMFHNVQSEQIKADPKNVDARKTDSETNAKQTASVVLTIDYGDGMQKRFPQLPWKDGMTAFEALRWSAKHPRGISLKSRGKGATTLVLQIDDLKNGEPGNQADGSSGKSKKNWIFRVNDQIADRSCGVFKLKAGDRILWKFDEYQ